MLEADVYIFLFFFVAFMSNDLTIPYPIPASGTSVSTWLPLDVFVDFVKPSHVWSEVVTVDSTGR